MNKKVNKDYERVGEMATIFLRGKIWCVNAQHRGKQHRKSLKTRNKKEARKKALAYEQELLQGSSIPTVIFEPVSIATSAEEMILSCEAENLRPKTITKYQQVLSVMARFAESQNIEELSQVDIRFIDHFRAFRKQQGAKPKTIHTEIGIIRRLLHFAKSRRLIAEDPLEGLRLPKPKSSEQPCWNKEEIEQILNHASPHHLQIFTLLAETGLRIGELKWLTWKDIDTNQNLIHIRPKDDWTTKTGNVRSIPMSNRARKIIFAQKKNCRWVFTARASKKYPQGNHQISERRLLESLKRTLKKIGLKGHLHTFRHSFISRAIIEGIAEAIIRNWVGHVDDKTLQHYTHIAARESRAAMEKMNNDESA